MVTTRRGLDTQALGSATLVAGVNEQNTSGPDIERADRSDDESDHSPPDDASDHSPPEKKFRDHIIGEIWMEIDASIAENGGSSYGIVSSKLSQHKKKFKWINRDLLYNYWKQATREMQLPPHEVSLQSACAPQAISELTFNEAACAGNGNIDHQDRPEENSTSSVQNEQSRNFGGRPKGTTNVALRDVKFKVRLALNWAAVEFERAKGNGRSQWGIYDKIIKEANEKFNLTEKHWLNKQTVRTRLRPSRKILAANPGINSPMIRMEGYFVDMFLTLGAMRQPSNAT